MSIKRKYDRDKKEYTVFENGNPIARIFRTGFGGIVEWTGISEWGSFGFPTLRAAMVEMLGWDKYQEWKRK